MALSSASVEEYLEAIYGLNEKGKLAKNQDLSEKLNVSPPSVTQMIQRLAEEGLVIYEPYKGTQLTGKGMALAQKVVRKHRLLEVFLHDILKLPKENVHDQACKMEHTLTDETASALCKVLNNPERCIDEDVIPECSLNVQDCQECEEARSKYQEFPLITQLSNLKPTEEGKVAFIRGGKQSSKRIQEMGLTPGTHIKMVNSAPFKGPIEVEVRGTNLALGRGLASQVFIEVEDEDQPWARAHPHGPHHSIQSKTK
jgi:DtxR family transcriptional regulator, Mn-dependent transcriptional regulator